MNGFLSKFLPEVAWPAAAGNVAWSFASLAIDRGINATTAPRLAVLLLLALYLSAQWHRSREMDKNKLSTRESIILDAVFVICIVWLAIATQADKGFPGAALLLILSLLSAGHLCGVWQPAGERQGNIPFGITCLVALIGLGLVWCIYGWKYGFAVIAIAAVLVAWVLFLWDKTSTSSAASQTAGQTHRQSQVILPAAAVRLHGGEASHLVAA